MIKWLFSRKKKIKEKKVLNKSEKMNEELRQAFLNNRSIMNQFPTHREWMEKEGKPQTE